MMIYFVKWLTGTIGVDSDNGKLPTRCEQDLKLHRTWIRTSVEWSYTVLRTIIENSNNLQEVLGLPFSKHFDILEQIPQYEKWSNANVGKISSLEEGNRLKHDWMDKKSKIFQDLLNVWIRKCKHSGNNVEIQCSDWKAVKNVHCNSTFW